MASGSQNMTTYNARTVTGSDSAASPAGALLLSGANRADDATGDTWIFLDSLEGTSTPWGIKHDQANNKIHIYGNNIDSIWARMDTGDTYILGKVGIGYDPETSEHSYKLYVNGTSYFTDHMYIAAAKHIYMSYNSTNYNILHNHNNGNISLNAAGAGLYMAYQNTTFVNWMNGRMELRDGCLSLFPNNSSYREGLRIHATGGWSDITLCGNDNTGNSGTSANSWFIGNNNGNFYIARNGSPGSTAWLECVNNIWSTMNPIWIKGGSTEAGTNANRLTTSSGTPGNMQYNSSHRGVQIYSNGIAFADPYNGNSNNDAGWIRHIEETANTGTFEFAVGDDNSNEAIVFRRYTTSNTVGKEAYIFDASGNSSFPGTVTATKFSGPLTGNVTGNCSGSSGSCTGNAASATYLKDRANSTASYLNYGAAGLAASEITWLCCWNGYEVRAISKAEMANAVDSSHKWVRLAGDTMTGNLTLPVGGRLGKASGNLYIGASDNSGWVLTQDICSHTGTGDTYWSLRSTGVAHFKTAYGAVWNDYAEMRNVPKAQIDIHRIYDDKGEIERNYPYAGHCVYEIGDGTMELTNARLAKGCKIISDTFGFCIGETEDCKTPIAVTGRVLAYPYENIEEYKNHIGDCVCSGPNGTISIMTLEEKIQYPECIVGTISEIPSYTIWRCGNKDTKPIKVNGRIWIYVR